MHSTPNRQTRKRLATRQKISDVATRLFITRGFDNVTMDEIAEAADVSRMTVFNHFSRKEDLFFDLDEEGRDDLLEALRKRAPGTTPVEALRQFAHWAVAQRRPYVGFGEAGSDKFLATIEASEALKSRARAIRGELTDTLMVALAGAVDRRLPDPVASLAASLLVATWTVAFIEAHRIFQQQRDVVKANQAFLALIDRGSRGVQSGFGRNALPISFSQATGHAGGLRRGMGRMWAESCGVRDGSKLDRCCRGMRLFLATRNRAGRTCCVCLLLRVLGTEGVGRGGLHRYDFVQRRLAFRFAARLVFGLG